MKNWTKTKSILKESRILLKKGLRRYLVFSMFIPIISSLYAFVPLITGSQQRFLNILIIIGLLIIGIFPRIGLILCIEADQRGERYTFKEIISRIKLHWIRTLGAYVLYWFLILAVMIFGTLVISLGYMVTPFIILGIFGVYALGIWLAIRLLFMRYIAILDPSKPLTDSSTFKLTEGWFWILLRTNINTCSGWILMFIAIRNGASALGYTALSETIPYITSILLVFLVPYQTAAEIILYRRCKEQLESDKSAETAPAPIRSTLFPDIPDPHMHPGDFSKTPYTYYCASDDAHIGYIKDTLNSWFAHYPSGKKIELQKRIQSAFGSVFYELFLHELLSNLHCSVVVNDRSNNAGKKTDFAITEMSGKSLVLEARVRTYIRENQQMIGEHTWRNPVREVIKGLKGTARRYDIPHIIALNCLGPTAHRDDVDALFGDKRGNNGFWSPYKNTHVSAVLISSIHPQLLLTPSIHARLYLNPWAQYPYAGTLTQLDTYQVDDQGLVQCAEGRNILDILGIDNTTFCL